MFPWKRRSLVGGRCQKSFDKSRRCFVHSPKVAIEKQEFFEDIDFFQMIFLWKGKIQF